MQIYGDEPLEDGEIDTKRARAFTSCVRKEYKSKRVRDECHEMDGVVLRSSAW